MTSNQLSYWRLQEDERANRAKEAENIRSNRAKEEEAHRTNVTNEKIREIQNELEKRNLDIRDNQLLMQLAELYQDGGSLAWENLPDDVQDKLSAHFGTTGFSANRKTKNFGDFFYQLNDILGHWIGGGAGSNVAKVISALF